MACVSASNGSAEKCSLLDPEPGDYWIFVDNFEATDPTGSETDDVTLALAVVPGSDEDNINVVMSGGAAAPLAKEPFDLDLTWDLTTQPNPGNYWYGAFDLGSSFAEPGNLGTVCIDLYRCSNGHIRVLPTDAIYSESLQAVYDAAVIDDDTLELLTDVFIEDLEFARDIAITLTGGYACDYSKVVGTTTIKGSIIISAGTVTFENLILAASD